MFEDSAVFWFPRIEHVPGINVPRTVMIPFDEDMIVTITANVDMFIAVHGEPFEHALDSFDFPVFVRTDEMARKHDWKNTCFVQDRGQFYHHVRNLVVDSTRVSEECRAIMIREMLHLDTGFEWFNGMPVSRERRYFVDNGAVTCHHPYWHDDAFDSIPSGLKRVLDDLNREPGDEVALLSGMATRVSAVLGGAFSVDFAMDSTGTWWLIDIATARNSYHPPCRFNEET